MEHLYNYLPIYPEFEKDVEEILGEDYVEEGNPNYNIYRKKEFYDYRLEKQEDKPTFAGQLMKHQTIISRFISSYTPYQGILLMHEPGTGKTCSSIAAIEKIRRETNSFKGALVIMKGDNLINNYINELVFTCTCEEKFDNKCTKGKYIPDKYYTDELTEEQKKRRINKNISDFYEFQTFEVFNRYIKKKKKETLIKQYSNRIIVIDEAHNLRISDEESQYESIHYFLHIVKDCKIILLTGTPMVDRPEEIASIMNLILPVDKQLPVGREFVDEYLEQDPDNEDSSIIKQSKVKKLKSYLHGRVSYLQAMKSEIKKKYVGNLDLKYFNLFSMVMDEFQMETYMKAYALDTEQTDKNKKKGVYNESIQSSLFVFPDGSYGKKGFEKYLKKEDIKSLVKVKDSSAPSSVYSLKDSLKTILTDGKTVQEKLAILRKYSVKYAELIEKLLDPEDNSTHFIYIKLVKGSGAILFSKILEIFGFAETKGKTMDKKFDNKRFSIITNETTTDTENLNILKVFNDPKNYDGKNIKFIIGSKMISEGITLKNVQNIHILTPSWNFSEIDQAIARGYRLFSHSVLESMGFDVIVKIYLYCSLPLESDISKSIDYQMYKTSEDKDLSIKSIEYVIKQASFDCALNKRRNLMPSSFDGSRECAYKDCEYKCDGIKKYDIEEDDIDLSTYNLYYNDDKVEKIIEHVLDIFRNKEITSISIDDIFNISEDIDIDKFSLYKAIDLMVSDNYMIKNKLGYKCFIRFDNNCIYLTYNIKNNSNFLDNFYVKEFPLQEIVPLDEKIEDKYYEYLPLLFERVKKTEDTEEKQKLLSKFPLDIQETMIEMSVLSKEMGQKNVDPIREFIIDNYKSYLLTIDEEDEDNKKIVSTLLFNKKDEDDEKNSNLRCLSLKDVESDIKDKEIDDVWEDCDEKSKQNVVEKLKAKKLELEENPYGYYGILDLQDNFFIRDVSSDKKKKGQVGKTHGKMTTKGRSTGKACISWNKKELLKVVHNIKLDYDKDYTRKFDKKDDLDSLYDENVYKDIKSAFTLEEFSGFDREDKLRLLYWGKSGKEGKITIGNICDKLKDWFRKKELVEKVTEKK